MDRPDYSPTVLLVEDDVLQLLDMADYIEGLGYEVIQASNSDRAIELLETRPDIRLLVTDIDMPGAMNGIALARAVRERWPPVQIIVVSGTDKDIASLLPERSAYLRKPVSNTALRSALQTRAPM